MTSGNPELDLLARALDQTATAIDRIRPDQAGLPTPCRSWDVRALVNHTVADARFFAARVAGAAWERRDADLVGDDWAGAFRAAAADLLTAWRREGALDSPVKLPFGEMPA